MRAKTSGERDGNKSRARQKHEIAELRETVVQFEGELTRLRRLSHPRQEPSVTQWRGIAERQRHERYTALTENAKLRYKIDKQLSIAKKLAAQSYGIRHTEAVRSLCYRPVPEMSALRPSLLDDAAVMREMETTLPKLLAQCGTAFEHSAFQTKTFNVHHVEKRESLEAGIQVISAERRVWPFGRTALSDAVLRLFSEMRALGFTRLHSQLEIQGGFASSDLAALVEVAQFRGVSRAKLMARRYDYESQTLIVFTGMTDASNAINVPCDGLLLQHSGWVRLRSLADCSGATTYEAYHVAVPAAFDVVDDQKRKAALLTSFMEATIGFHIDAGRDEVERFLLTRPPVC